jgi:hypothetical protein
MQESVPEAPSGARSSSEGVNPETYDRDRARPPQPQGGDTRRGRGDFAPSGLAEVRGPGELE